VPHHDAGGGARGCAIKQPGPDWTVRFDCQRRRGEPVIRRELCAFKASPRDQLGFLPVKLGQLALRIFLRRPGQRLPYLGCVVDRVKKRRHNRVPLG